LWRKGGLPLRGRNGREAAYCLKWLIGLKLRHDSMLRRIFLVIFPPDRGMMGP